MGSKLFGVLDDFDSSFFAWLFHQETYVPFLTGVAPIRAERIEVEKGIETGPNSRVTLPALPSCYIDHLLPI
jgi:hypothetical protein